VRGEAFLQSTCAANAFTFHKTRHLIPSEIHARFLRGPRELASSIDGVVLLEQTHQLWPDFIVALFTCRGWTGFRLVVGGGGDLELLQDRLDSPSKPIGLVVPVGFDESNYFVDRRSNSAPKKVMICG
jgi:hypothetical protein